MRDDVAIVHNLWTIYTIERANGGVEHLAMCGHRPPDWGAPGKYMYRVVTGGNFRSGQRCLVHCWYDRQVSEQEFFRLFHHLLLQQYGPGEPPEKCERTHLTDDDIWDDAWGERPPRMIQEEDLYDGD